MADTSTTQPGNPEPPGNQQPSPDTKDLRQTAADPQRGAAGNPALRRHHAVVRRLIANGISATIEYPGCVVIELDPETTVWTGLEGWAYGTVHRLRDGIMHDTDELAEPGGVPSSRETPKSIADAWTHWVRTYQASAAGDPDPASE